MLCWSYAPYFLLGVFNTIQHLCARVIVWRVQHSYLCPRALLVVYTIITICVLVHLIGVFNTAMCSIVSLLVVYNTAIWVLGFVGRLKHSYWHSHDLVSLLCVYNIHNVVRCVCLLHVYKCTIQLTVFPCLCFHKHHSYLWFCGFVGRI